jgi:transposase-like protein
MTDADDTILACPDCNSAPIRRRQPGSAYSDLPASAGRYRCPACGHTFDSPRRRARKLTGDHLAARLEGIDADAITADPGGESA